VIGVDMTPDMVTKARANARTFAEQTGLDNVEFRLGEIEHLPVADASVDVVISNCVINLSPEKDKVWREIARVLRPGGRVSVSDIALLKPLPDELRSSAAALVGCVAGAVLIEETEALVRDAGLADPAVEKDSAFAEAAGNVEDPLYRDIVGHLPEGSALGDFIVSMHLTAHKPRQ